MLYGLRKGIDFRIKTLFKYSKYQTLNTSLVTNVATYCLFSSAGRHFFPPFCKERLILFFKRRPRDRLEPNVVGETAVTCMQL